VTESLSQIAGIWRSRGYGWVFDIRADGFVRWDVTERTGIEADRGPASDFLSGFDRIDRASADELSLFVADEITRYHFSRLRDLPAVCHDGGTPRSRDPRRNFEAFWQQFRDHYAFFPLKGVDWDDSLAAHRGRVGPGTSDDELLDIFAEMTAPLQDAHVAIVGGGRVVKTSRIQAQRALLERELGIGPYWEHRHESNSRICALLDREFLRGTGKRACNDLLLWGEVAPGIGYLAVLGMFGFTDDDSARRRNQLPRRRREGAAFLRSELAALESAIDPAIADLAHCRAIVVDVRINSGGFDIAALEIAGRFADRQRLAFTKEAWNGHGFEPPQSIHVAPAGPRQFTGPVLLLTSPLTPSAGEIFVLGMMALPHVARIGETTLGILSDNLYKDLPNGWELSISNELYRAADGHLYEDRGIPPEVEVPVFDEDDVAGGLRRAVDRAVEIGNGAPGK
jgi:hypothetical protein